MMFLSKEDSNEDERLKMEMVVSMGESLEKSTARVWKEKRIFGGIRELILSLKEPIFLKTL